MKLHYCSCGETSRSPTGLRLLLLNSFFVVVVFLLTSNAVRVKAEFDEEKLVKKLHAPKIVDPRDDLVVLRCDYDLQGKKLDLVNWYKSDNMLYRFMPSMSTKGTSFTNNNEIKVDLEKSNGTHLVLRGHRDKAKNAEAYKGTYFCEVSTETPMLTDYAEATINVAIIPKENPKLEGLAPNYQVGEMLEATCTSAPSLPASELTFYLNDKKVNSTRQISVENSDGSFSTKSSLSMLLERYHFPDDSLILSCQTTVPDIRLERDYKTEKIAALAAHGLSLQELPSIFRSSSSSSIQAVASLVLVGFVAML